MTHSTYAETAATSEIVNIGQLQLLVRISVTLTQIPETGLGQMVLYSQPYYTPCTIRHVINYYLSDA